MKKLFLCGICLFALAGCQSAIRFASDAGRTSGENSVRAKKEIAVPLALSPTEQTLVESAKSWLGTPYRYAGTTRDGVDCSALMVNIFTEVGVQLPRKAEDQFSFGQTVSEKELSVGDLLFYNTTGAGVSHVGVYVGNDQFIHASTSLGVTVQSVYDSYFVRRFLGARRILWQ